MATLTLEEFLPKARQLNPDYTDEEHTQAYEQRYGRQAPVHTVSAAPLKTFEDFLPKARALNPDYSDEEHRAAWQEKYGARGARENDQGDFIRGGVTAFKQIPQTVRGLEAGAGAIGEKIAGQGGLFTALKNHGLKGYQEHAADIAKDAKPSDSVSEAYGMAKAGDPGALVDWLQYALGYGGGQALQMLATAGVGYAGGKLALQPAAKVVAEKMIAKESARLAATGMAGEQLAKQAVSNVAGKIGQIGALGATAVGMEGGEIYGGLVEKAAAENRSLTGAELAKAAGATLGAGVLEFVGDKVGYDLVLGKSIAGKLAKSRLGHAAAAGTLGVATEGGTEFTQTLIEEFGKGNDPFSPESIKQAIDAAALGGVGGGAVGTAGGLVRKPEGQTVAPTVTERQPEDIGLTPVDAGIVEPIGAKQITGPPQPGEMRGGKIYGDGPIIDVSPLPDVTPVTQATSLDEAIANAVGVVQGATATGKQRAAEFARMTARAKNETDALLEAAPAKRPAFEPPVLPGPTTDAPSLLNQPSPIVPGQGFTPRPEPVDDPRARLAEERARLVAMQEQRRLEQQANPKAEVVATALAIQPAEDVPLPSQADLAYPSSKQVRDLIHEKGFHLDTPVFREYLKQAVGKEKFGDLTPIELQRLHDKVAKIQAAAQPKPIDQPAPSVSMAPIKEQPYAPVTTIPEAQVPRSELTPEKNAEVLLRAEKAKADMEIAGAERGGRFHVEQSGTGGTNEVIGLKSPTADWYKDLTSGPSPVIRGDRKQSAREKIEDAIQKIIKDQGADRGKAVEQVKAALLQDQEFHKTEWGRDLSSILEGEWPSWVDKPGGVGDNDNKSPANAISGGESAIKDADTSIPIKVPPSRSQRLAQQKQKTQAKQQGAEPLQSETPGMEPPSATAQPEREPAPPKTEAAPTSWAERLADRTNPALYVSADEQVKADEALIRKLRNLDKPTIDAYDPTSAVYKSGRQWSYHTISGNSGQGIYDTRREATEVAVRHKQLMLDQYENPTGYADATSELARESLKLIKKYEGQGLSEMQAAEKANDEIERLHGYRDTLRGMKMLKSFIGKAAGDEPFALSSPEVRTAKPKAEDRQTSIQVEPETIGTRPIIGRETTPEESPLFSKAAQEREAEQVSLPEESAPEVAPTRAEVAPAQPEPAQSPTEIIDRIPEGMMVSVKAIRSSTGDYVTVQADARTALRDLDASETKYRQLLECLQS